MVLFSSKQSAGAQASPLDKEGSKLDGLGRKVYTSGARISGVTNFMVLIGRYQMVLWEPMV